MDHHREEIKQKIDALLDFIEKTPKSGKWKSRAKAGI